MALVNKDAHGAVTVLTLNDPPVNGYTHEMMKELDARMAANELALERAVAGARRQTRKRRATVVPTEVIKPEPETETEIVAEPPAEDEPLTRDEAEVAPEPKPAARRRQARSR